MGDLNDVPDAASTMILYGPEGSQPKPEDATNPKPSSAFHKVDGGDKQRLINVALLVPEPEPDRWSRRSFGRNELIDHVLASDAFMPRDGAGLRAVPTVTIGNKPTVSIDNTPRTGEERPDHAPVMVEFGI
jgi:hypothetical protein